MGASDSGWPVGVGGMDGGWLEEGKGLRPGKLLEAVDRTQTHLISDPVSYDEYLQQSDAPMVGQSQDGVQGDGRYQGSRAKRRQQG